MSRAQPVILVGNQRGGGKDLALHLMKDENERVQLHELRGFVSTDLIGAFQESHAISRGTHCKQHLYSLSLSPPKDAKPDDAAFIDAVDRAEQRLGLEGQPRAVVFHEKKGRDGETRRHAHAVWCRINMETMTAKQISFDRRKLNDLARDLYIEHDWQMPRGFLSHEESNPRNYSLAEWQQAKRAEKDPDKLKRLFQDSWAISDGKAAFSHALEERGYILARGDRRGFVAVDYEGEVYSLSRWIGKKPKELKARLQTGDDLPCVKQAHEKAAKIVTDRLKKLEAEEAAKQECDKARAAAERRYHEAHARAQETALKAAQEQRRAVQEAECAQHVRTGLRGLLDRLTGKRKRIEEQNRQEMAQARERDDAEKWALHTVHARELSEAQRRAAFIQARRQGTRDELQQDRKAIVTAFADNADPEDRKAAFRAQRSGAHERSKRRRTRDAPEPSL